MILFIYLHRKIISCYYQSIFSVSCRLGGVGSLCSYQEKFKKIGMQKEIEAVIDSLWDIDKEIQQLAYKEPQIYGFNFKYISDGWRTLIELFKEHVGKEPRFKKL